MSENLRWFTQSLPDPDSQNTDAANAASQADPNLDQSASPQNPIDHLRDDANKLYDHAKEDANKLADHVEKAGEDWLDQEEYAAEKAFDDAVGGDSGGGSPGQAEQQEEDAER